MLDVKRERELDERRKNEKIEISEDHPVRKLLLRMKERHSMRISSANTLNDPFGNASGDNKVRDFFLLKAVGVLNGILLYSGEMGS